MDKRFTVLSILIGAGLFLAPQGALAVDAACAKLAAEFMAENSRCPDCLLYPARAVHDVRRVKKIGELRCERADNEPIPKGIVYCDALDSNGHPVAFWYGNYGNGRKTQGGC